MVVLQRPLPLELLARTSKPRSTYLCSSCPLLNSHMSLRNSITVTPSWLSSQPRSSYLVAPFTLLHLKTGAAAVAVRPSGGTLLDRDRQGRQPSHLSVWFMGTPSTETKVMVPVKVCPSADMVIVNA